MRDQKPVASLSLDLDNQWSYMKTRGDEDWLSMPSYLNVVVPRILSFLEELNLRITVFVVGQDAASDADQYTIKSISEAGHDIGNHSFRHEPWLHLYSASEIEEEIARSEEAIQDCIGQRPVGFRGPGYSLSVETLRVLQRRSYLYDASTFPTFIGPIARTYYFLSTRLGTQERSERKNLFGKVSDGFRPLKPYYWSLDDAKLLEIPVTTIPIFRMPFHVSYLDFLARHSLGVARSYLEFGMFLCRQREVAPSLLLHPLDFLGVDDGIEPLAFFPGMDVSVEQKLGWLRAFLTAYCRHFDVISTTEFAERIESKNVHCETVRNAHKDF